MAEVIDKKKFSGLIGITLLVLGVLIIYWQTSDFAFVSFDDPDYVYKNEIVRQGLSWLGFKWAFTTFHAANWHPLTWLSHMLDVTLFGLDAGAHHFASMGWHLVNTVLLYIVLRRLTGAAGRSLLVAVFFAWHPLRVESVAWVSERKDLLCVFFWLLSLLAYHYYTLRPVFKRYLLLFFAVLLALLAKPMAVTLPFLLFLLDFWPLNRIARVSWKRLIFEKIPLLLLVAGTAMMTFMAQNQAGAVASTLSFSFGQRLANALVSYVKYLELTFFPRNLAVLYLYHGLSSALTICGCVLLLSLVTWWSFRERYRAPFLLLGWLWFLGTLVPVIGIVQVGGQALADRYTYFPTIGVGIFLVWGLEALCPAALKFKAGCAAFIIAMLVLVPISWHQVRFWRNSVSLFSRALAVDPSNYYASSDLGVALQDAGRKSEALAAFTRALEINPNYGKGLFNLGIAQEKMGHYHKAEKTFTKALVADPGSVKIYAGLARSKMGQKDIPAAIGFLRKGLAIDPDSPDANYLLGVILLKDNQVVAAIEPLKQVLKIQPENLNARVNLGVAEGRLGHYTAARQEFQRVLQLNPGHHQARYNLQQLENLQN
jgi:tetratricopeptide (TPR) repeat protein